MNKALTAIKSGITRYDFSLVVFIFFLVFAPPLVPQINTALFATAIAFVLLVTKYRGSLVQTVKDSQIWKFFILMCAFFLYLAVVTLINVFVFKECVQLMHYIKLWYRLFMIVPVLLICTLYICIRCKELKYSVYDLGMCFVYATLVQFVLAFAALICPQIKAFFVAVMYKNTGDAYLGTPWVMERRGFGFSNSFVDSFGFGMGLIGALPLFFVNKKRWKIICTVPFLIFVSLVNVRTGLLIAAVGFVISVPVIVKAFKTANKKARKKFLITAVIAVILLALLVALVQVVNPKTIKWILGDFSSVVESVVPDGSSIIEKDIFEGMKDDSKSTTADILFSERFWNLPKGVTLIFGCGHTIFGAEGYPNSDVGYVNDLWMGGVIGALLLYSSFVWLFVKSFKITRKLNIKCLVIFFAISVMIFQIKANAIAFNAGINTILPILFYVIFSAKQEIGEGE